MAMHQVAKQPAPPLMLDSSATLRLLIADERPIFRDGLAKLLESEPGFRVIGQAGDATAGLQLARQLTPDLLLLHLGTPNLSGLATLLGAAPVPCRILLMTMAIEREQLAKALQLGVRGVVTKESTTELLFKSIRCVMANQYWLGRESVSDVVQYLRDEFSPEDTPPPRLRLTPREKQIVAAIVTGCTNKDIAQRFSISEDTVKHHVSNVFDKLGVSNRLELALFAVHHHLVDEDR